MHSTIATKSKKKNVTLCSTTGTKLQLIATLSDKARLSSLSVNAVKLAGDIALLPTCICIGSLLAIPLVPLGYLLAPPIAAAFVIIPLRDMPMHQRILLATVALPFAGPILALMGTHELIFPTSLLQDISYQLSETLGALAGKNKYTLKALEQQIQINIELLLKKDGTSNLIMHLGATPSSCPDINKVISRLAFCKHIIFDEFKLLIASCKTMEEKLNWLNIALDKNFALYHVFSYQTTLHGHYISSFLSSTKTIGEIEKLRESLLVQTQNSQATVTNKENQSSNVNEVQIIDAATLGKIDISNFLKNEGAIKLISLLGETSISNHEINKIISKLACCKSIIFAGLKQLIADCKTTEEKLKWVDIALDEKYALYHVFNYQTTLSGYFALYMTKFHIIPVVKFGFPLGSLSMAKHFSNKS